MKYLIFGIIIDAISAGLFHRSWRSHKDAMQTWKLLSDERIVDKQFYVVHERPIVIAGYITGTVLSILGVIFTIIGVCKL